MSDIFSRHGARMTKSECRYCKGTGFLEHYVGEANGTMRKQKLRCRHIVGAPLGEEGMRFA